MDPLIEIIKLQLVPSIICRPLRSMVHFAWVLVLQLLHEELRLIKDLAKEEQIEEVPFRLLIFKLEIKLGYVLTAFTGAIF